MLRNTAEAKGDGAFDYEYGDGVLNVRGLLDGLEQLAAGRNGTVSGHGTAPTRRNGGGPGRSSGRKTKAGGNK